MAQPAATFPMASGSGLAPEWELYAQQLLDLYNEFPDLPRSQVDGTVAIIYETMDRCERGLPTYAQQLRLSAQQRLASVPTWRTAWSGMLVGCIDCEMESARVEARRLRLRVARRRLLLAQAAGAAARALPSDVVTLVARHLPAAVRRSYLCNIAKINACLRRDSESRKRRRQ